MTERLPSAADPIRGSGPHDQPPTEARGKLPGRSAPVRRGLVIVNTGDGKGKTTAALGIVTRAWGRRMRAGVVRFISDETRRCGETQAAARMGVDWLGAGQGWTWGSGDGESAVRCAREGWRAAQECIDGERYDVLVLDEFTYPLQFGWLDTAEVVAWLRAHKPAGMHLVITGRRAPEELIGYADLVTEMRQVKHPYADLGIAAQAGIEF